MRMRALMLAAAMLAAGTGRAAGQRLPAGRWPESAGRAAADGEAARDSSHAHRPLALAKWVVLGTALAAAAYGYEENRLADSRFEDLDKLCQAQPARCTPRTASGGYADPELESRYQEVRRLDRRATVGLVTAEVGVAGAVALFLLDLRHAGREPPNIPYKPPKLEVGPGAAGQLRIGVSVER